jgi:hypothetical protein
MEEPPLHLEMSAVDLINALKLLAAAKGGGPLTLAFNGTELEIVRGVTRVAVPAVGRWPVTAVVRTQLVKDLLSRRIAFTERVVVTGTDSHLHFSHYSIPCSWRSDRRQVRH